jgi:protease IV
MKIAFVLKKLFFFLIYIKAFNILFFKPWDLKVQNGSVIKWVIKPVPRIPIDLRIFGPGGQMIGKNYENNNLLSNIIALNLAALDPKIKGIKIIMDDVSSLSVSVIQEILASLYLWKKNGKKITIVAKSIETFNQALLFSIADERVLFNMGSFVMPGYFLDFQFAGKKNAKKGMNAEIIKTNLYKAGGMPEGAESLDFFSFNNYKNLILDLTEQGAEVFAFNQKISLQDSYAYMRKTFFTPQEAKNLGFVTKITESLEFKEADEKNITLSYYSEYNKPFSRFLTPNVGFIDISFSFMNGFGYKVAKEILKLDRPEIKACLVWVNSGGGDAVEAYAIIEALNKLKEKGKYIVAVVNLAASGGYWVASVADKIFAQPGSLVGSISAFNMQVNASEYLKKKGYTFERVSSYDSMGSSPTQKSYDSKIFDMNMIDNVGNYFTNSVKNFRGISEDLMKDLAQGQVYSALYGSKIGLVDELGGLIDAINLLVSVCNSSILKFDYIPNIRMLSAK